MKRKGQVTIFIILGLILILVAGFLIMSNYKQKKTYSDVDQLDLKPIKLFVKSCIYSTAKDAILHNGYSGGYFVLPLGSTTNLSQDVPYYYNLGKINVPSNKQLSSEIGSYVDTMLKYCLNDFKTFKEYKITMNESETEVIMNPDKISLKTSIPMEVLLKQNTQKGNFVFDSSVATKQLFLNFAMARKIVNSITEDGICLTCYNASKESLSIQVLPMIDGTLIDITDNDYLINNEMFKLRFAVRLNESI